MTGVFNIPAGIPFAQALAAQLLQESVGQPEYLASLRILLPTRRSCAVLREYFLRLNNGKPMLLPRLQPLGDIEEEELSLSLTAQQNPHLFETIAPSMPAIQRRLLLARLILQTGSHVGTIDQALPLAEALGRLMDQIYTEGLDIKNFSSLVPEEFADHWQITLHFLQVISESWPRILAAHGMIDAADRRNRLLRALSLAWKTAPPPYPVIAAGSTGSIPATAQLLAVIAGLPQGRLVLPGLDDDMEDESWNALEESHPQYGLKELLNRLQIDRRQVVPWPNVKDTRTAAARRFLVREALRPAATVSGWADLTAASGSKATLKKALQNMCVIEAPQEHDEAMAIAMLFRQTLENPGKTAALITPDRALARRVAATCGRWNITIDDSAGRTLDQTRTGSFLRLCLEAALEQFSPVALLALLRHELTTCGMKKSVFRRKVEILEKLALRGPRPQPGLGGLEKKIASLGDLSASEMIEFLRVIAPCLQRLVLASGPTELLDFRDLAENHLCMAEALAESPSENHLWSAEEGEAASRLFAEIIEYANIMPPLTLASYAGTVDALMKTITVRKPYGAHPRLKILGPLEARLTEADLVILGGLNEGTWPQESAYDPWMSRPMRKTFGLPSSARAVSLSAHDFVEGFCAPEIVLTLSRRRQNAPAVPARWLQRLSTVLQAAGMDLPQATPLLLWQKSLDRPKKTVPALRPRPCPPLAARPRKMAATKVEIWLRDPYSIYARYILGLKKLQPLEKSPDAAERGILLHKILQQFINCYPATLPPHMPEILEIIAVEELEKFHEDPSVWSFWKPRFRRIAQWLEIHETLWRGQGAKNVKTEIKGQTEIDQFILEAIPDRIDNTPDGPAIIDYKSGGAFSLSSLVNGTRPQLALEALILRQGGFPGLPAVNPSRLAYWILTGGSEPGEIKAETNALKITEAIENAAQGMKDLIAAFRDENTPYYSLPVAGRKSLSTDYDHLARILEWSSADSNVAEAA